MEIKTFARVYVDLELSVNKKFAAYGTRVKILATLKSPCAKSCHMIQKFEFIIGSCICLNILK